MSISRRIYMSMPADQWLTPNQNEVKWGVVEEIEALGYKAEIFFDPRGKPGLAAAKAWSAVEADNVARHCIGGAIIGLPRWNFSTSNGQIILPTEFSHYEGAVVFTLGLPMLVLVEEDVQRRVVFDQSYRGYVGIIPLSADRSWLATDRFRVPFRYWKEELSRRRDIFLGYSSTSEGTAKNLKRFLQADLDVTVLDWKTDFAPGRSILQQIEEASSRCSAGIFLFTTDDKLLNDTLADKAVPRDNVVFEAGYFISAKGKDHVLIIREEGAKMPADLGGDIYASLKDKSDISPIEDTVQKFVEAL